jgi:phosphate transport system permease protein
MEAMVNPGPSFERGFVTYLWLSHHCRHCVDCWNNYTYCSLFIEKIIVSFSKSFLKRRHLKEKWFRKAGALCVILGLLFLGAILADILYKGYPAFFRTEISSEVSIPTLLNPHVTYQTNRSWQIASDEVDQYYKKGYRGKLSQDQIQILEELKNKNQIRLTFNGGFFTHSDSREPELAGIWGGLVGSLLTLFVTFITAFPLGVGTAIYLEEFASHSKIAHFIEANINNLAAIPSILFGLLGLILFIHFMGLPRPSALVGGLTLGLMSLPVIVVVTRTSLSAVPQTLKEAALGLGATPLQVLFHHTLPTAMPGIMTGVLLSLARALGETAPLLLIGMMAFIAEPPSHFLDPATVLPVQIFNWSRSPELGFIENTSGAILVLLLLLGILNGIAIYIRKRFEKFSF